MSAEEDTTEIEGIFISFLYHFNGGSIKQQIVRLSLEEKNRGGLIQINYDVSISYANSLEDYIKEYFSKGKTSVKVKIKGKLEENKYEYDGTGLIKKLD